MDQKLATVEMSINHWINVQWSNLELNSILENCKSINQSRIQIANSESQSTASREKRNQISIELKMNWKLIGKSKERNESNEIIVAGSESGLNPSIPIPISISLPIRQFNYYLILLLLFN